MNSIIKPSFYARLRTIIMFLFFCIPFISSEAQNYVFEYDVDFMFDQRKRRYYHNLYISTQNGKGEVEVMAFNFYKTQKGRRIMGKELIPAKDGSITKIRTVSLREVKFALWFPDSSGKHYHTQYEAKDGQYDYSVPIGIEPIFPLFNTDEFSSTKTRVFRVYPELLFDKPNVPKQLSYDNKVVIPAIKGFPAKVYQWQYSLDGGVTWNFVPQNLIDSSNPELLKISGSDLVSEDEFIRHILDGDKFAVRIYNSVQPSESETLDLAISSPYITDVRTELPLCHGETNGQAIFTLSRPLYLGEVLEVLQDNAVLRFGDDSGVDLNADNQFTVSNLAAGAYLFKLKGSLKGFSTYSDAPDHQRLIEIKDRPQISVTVTQSDINCHGGSDGQISISCTGGTGQFKANLINTATQASTEINGSSSAPIVFTHLSAGTYQVKLLDSNGCMMNQNPLIAEVTLSQPPTSVSLALLTKTPPKAHNSSDGLLSIRVSGGTQMSGAAGYNVTWKNDKGQTFSSTSTDRDGETYTYVLSGIPAGIYSATVADARYASLSIGAKTIPCGCFAEETFELKGPDPLIVEIEESHFINCFDSNEGELTALPKGGVPFSTGDTYKYQWYQVTDTGEQPLPNGQTSIAGQLKTGKYLVQITDANGIVARSQIYSLEQPTPLEVTFETTAPGCADGKGRIKAIVKGGTAPYTYQWNVEGETKDVLENISGDNYFLHLTDARGCTFDQSVELSSPTSLKVTSEVKHPGCNGEKDGAIKLAVEGAIPPYTVKWDDTTETSLERKNLLAGIYKVTVTDSQNCPQHLSISLNEPKEIQLALSEPFTLCKGQSRLIKAECPHEGVKYSWLLDGKILPTTEAQHIATKGGLYEVIATTENGCSKRAAVNIAEAENDFVLDVAIPSIIEQGAEIHAVNISKTDGGTIEWRIPNEAKLISSNNEEAIFIIPTVGRYSISVLAHTNNCTVEIIQSIEVKKPGEIDVPKDNKTPLITKFVVSPNPTNGLFQARVELREPVNYTLSLYDTEGHLIQEFVERRVKLNTHDFDISRYQLGTYVLRLFTDEEQSALKVELQ